MRGQEAVKVSIQRIKWTLAVILATSTVVSVRLMLGGWPLGGWLQNFTARSPVLVAGLVATIFAAVVYRNRPRPEPDWACPDDLTVKYGIGVAVFSAVGVVVLVALGVLAP